MYMCPNLHWFYTENSSRTLASVFLHKGGPYVFLYYLCFYHKVDKYFKCVLTNQTWFIFLAVMGYLSFLHDDATYLFNFIKVN